jgi:hypothetical protein
MPIIDYASLQLPDASFDKEHLDEWIRAYGFCAISAADRLRIFDALEGAPRSPAEMSDALKLGEKAIESVCRVLVAMRILRAFGDGEFELTSHAEQFWLRSSPFYRGIEFAVHRTRPEYRSIVETLKTGWSPIGDGDKNITESWQDGVVSAAQALGFTKQMHSIGLSPFLAAVRSGALTDVEEIVDVGGGSGVFAALLAAHQPHTKTTVLDLKQVCEASKEILASTTSGSQVSYLPCNFFRDPWPRNTQALWLANVLHDWPLQVCRELLRLAHDSLRQGGMIYIHEALLDPGRCSPRWTTLFNLLMHMNHGAQQFTMLELFELLNEAGYVNPRIVHTYSYYSLIEAERA